MVAWASKNGRVAVTGGVRTPFSKLRTALCDVHVTRLAQVALQETLHRVPWLADRLDEVILGNVVMPADATNPARVAALYAGVPNSVPAFTVQRNCASGMEAIAQGASAVLHGSARSVLCGGAESMSTIPLLFPAETLGSMALLAKARSPWQKIRAIASLRPRHFKPVPALKLGLTDPTCNMMMGQTAEVLANDFGIGREEQDQFALRSHQRATAAIEAGDFEDQITPFYAGRHFKPVTVDIGPRADQTLESLSRLRPIFDRRDGTVTIGNSCQVTDGAAAMLLMNSAAARGEGMEILGYVRGYATAAIDPRRMGLGPVFAIDQLLQQTGMSLNDIDLFEINEAFAAQVLACAIAMNSDAFSQQQLGRSGALGTLDFDRLNIHGGAIAMGHPVGATGARIVLNLLLSMRKRRAEFGVAALCVGGGQGAALLLQLA